MDECVSGRIDDPGSQAQLTVVRPGGCAGCVSRRAFLTQSALATATAALLAACGDGQIGPGTITDPVGKTTIVVSTFPGLATVGTLVLIDGFRAVKRTGAATFLALSRACTHQGTPVELSGSGFVCPNHGSQFDTDGHVTLGPANQNLPTLATSYDPATDVLTIG